MTKKPLQTVQYLKGQIIKTVIYSSDEKLKQQSTAVQKNVCVELIVKLPKCQGNNE